MLFKNAIFYHLSDFPYTSEALEQKLQEKAFTPCKSQELTRFGWTAPAQIFAGEKQSPLVAALPDGGLLICAKKEEKILPSSVIKAALQEKVDQIELERKVYKKEKDQLRDEVILDLLPRAFSKHRITTALIMPTSNLLVVDSSSHSQAEELLSHLRATLGSLPVRMLDVKHAPSVVMTNWVENNASPPEFEVLDRATLADSLVEGGQIAIKQQVLTDEEILAHLEAGKRITRLAVKWDESLRFMLADDLSIKGIKPTDQYMDRVNDADPETRLEQFEVDLALTLGSFAKLVPQLTDAFGGAYEQAAA